MKLTRILFEKNEDEALEVRTDYKMEHPDDHLFIRFGKYSGASKFGLGSEWRQETGKMLEPGLSVYFVEKLGDSWNIEPPQRSRAMYHVDSDYFPDMLFDNFMPAIANDEVYILKGKLIPREEIHYDEGYGYDIKWLTYETGSDGEPVIDESAITVVQTLTTDEVLDKVKYDNWKLVGDISRWPSSKAREYVWNHVREEDDEQKESAGV